MNASMERRLKKVKGENEEKWKKQRKDMRGTKWVE